MASRFLEVTLLSARQRVLIGILAVLIGVPPDFAGPLVPRPSVRFERTTAEFGTVLRGAVVDERFTIFNDGPDALTVQRLEFSEPGMKARVKGTIAAGEKTEITITWDTGSVRAPGAIEGHAILYFNDPAHPRVQLTLEGTIKAAIEFDPRPAFYMSQFKGESTSRSITIRNNQDSPLRIIRLEPKGTHFRATYKTMERGKAFELKVTVPRVTEVGRFRESVIVHTDDPQHGQLHVEVNVLVKPDLFVDPDSVDFGQVSRSELAAHPDRLDLLQQTLVIARRSGIMKIRSVEMGADFLTVRTEPEVAAQRFKVDVGLIPSKLRTGTVDTTLWLLTDDPKNPKIHVRVKGSIID